MSDVVIAHATANDLAAVHQLESQAFPAPWRREFFESELRASGRLNLIAKRDGVLVGYLFSMFFYDEMHVNKIAVVEAERRKGIADTLMARCFAFAREHEIRTIALEVRQSNRGAQEFYRHLGFKSAYIRSRYYPDGESAVVMMTSITPRESP
ncbi:MAG TPA: ribosomal protein S18-alanine N-acetyltransferase [Thermoanaerobaculia bacterium]|nr:ribosomal protein S18-alanine N-acetyltransferase [Thermoanaerobaculia bacterium]